jgi:flagellar biosynthetic protein FliR
VPATFRLSVALLVALALAPSIAPTVPAQPGAPLAVAALILQEVVIGLCFGAAARAVMSALAVAGSAAGMATSLSMAQQIDPTMQENGATLGVLVGLIGLVLIFAAGLHLAMLEATVESYTRFPPGSFPFVGDLAALHVASVAQGFALGIQIAAPVIVFSLVFNVGIGLVGKLIPQVQVFFIAQPAVVLLGLAVFAIGFAAGVEVWLQAYATFVDDIG